MKMTNASAPALKRVKISHFEDTDQVGKDGASRAVSEAAVGRLYRVRG